MTEFIHSFEELDAAMFDLFMGVSIDGKLIEPTYYTPDVDMQTLKAPAVVFFRTVPNRDLSRWSNEEFYYDNPVYDAEGNLLQIDKRKSPEPWSVMYTVKTLYEYQQDGLKFNDYFNRLVTRGAVINIKGQNYTVEAVSAGLWGSQYKDFGKTEDGKRRFQETYAFKIDFYLEVDDRETEKVVREVVVENTSHI